MPKVKNASVVEFGRFDSCEIVGGVQHHADGLSRLLARRGIDIVNVIASYRSPGLTEIEPNYRQLRCPMYGVLKSVAIAPSMPLRVAIFGKEQDIKLAHFHFPDPLSLLSGLLLPSHVKFIVTWHSDILRQKVLLKIYAPLLNAFMKRVSKIIVPTPAHKESCSQVHRYLDDVPIQIIPFGIDKEKYDSFDDDAEIFRMVSRRNEKIIFSYGRHVYYKGFDYLLDALPNIEGAHLLLGGSGPLFESYLSKAKDLGIGDKVTFLGQLTDKQIGTLYRHCDIFCMPSIEPTEAFGYAQAYAMAFEKPVVCFDLKNGVTYLNQDSVTGLVVENKSPEKLAEALQRLINSPDLRRVMGLNAKVRIDQEFSNEIMVQKYLELMDEYI